MGRVVGVNLWELVDELSKDPLAGVFLCPNSDKGGVVFLTSKSRALKYIRKVPFASMGPIAITKAPLPVLGTAVCNIKSSALGFWRALILPGIWFPIRN